MAREKRRVESIATEPLLILSDQPGRFTSLGRESAGGRPVVVWMADDDTSALPRNGLRGDPGNPATWAGLASTTPVAIVDFADGVRAERVATSLRRSLPDSPVLLIDREQGAGRRRGSTGEGITWIDQGELLSEAIALTMRRIAARHRVTALRAAIGNGNRAAFLVQNDPDPDAIASALALRAVLGLPASRAPILTCGRVTRPENRRLLEELRERVRHVTASALSRVEPLVLVDVQPSYFQLQLGEVAAVLDHHPPAGAIRARYADVRTTFGASATMAAEYLLANGDGMLTTALATALLYGIITDTRSLTRAASEADLQMFAFLFSRADHEALRRIEHPSYAHVSLRRFGDALRDVRVRNGLAYLHLGRLPREQEHIVAQLAEFCLGIEGARMSAVSGLFGRKLVMSARALSEKARLGDRLRETFGDFGSAGGHPLMAKAVIRLAAWREAHPAATSDQEAERGIARALRAAMRRTS
ncbi:MAG: DHH family phosphoesterase [Gemmatimonadaceae bacterium]